MRSHAKASTQRQAAGPGASFSGPPGLFAFALIGALVLAALTASAASAALPTISTTTVLAVTAKAAVLEADINPEGEASSYHFEYGLADCSANPCTNVPAAPAGIGAGTSAVRVAKEISGLTPQTTYHFRVLATNASGTTAGADAVFKTYEVFTPDTSCANQAFRTGPAAALPDCRGYEMVSPVDKNGGEIATEPDAGNTRTAYTQTAVDGDKITYSSSTAFGGQASSKYSNQYIASRGADGWSTEGINAPQGLTIFDPIFSPFVELQSFYQAFSDDLSSAWLKDFDKQPLTADGLENYMNFYRRDNGDGSFEALTVNQPSTAFNNIFGEVLEPAEIQGVSKDGEHAVFAARVAMTPDAAATTKRQLYDYSGGELHLVSVLPGGEPAATEDSNVGTYFSAFSALWRASAWHNAVSEDGSRIFWTLHDSSREQGQIYVRIDGARTVPVSAGPGQWWTATPDGSKALFSEGALDTGEASLEVFDVDSETTTTIAGEVYGVAGASDDLSHIYFASKEVLDAGAIAGERNLYLRHGGVTSFIATISEDDARLGAVTPQPFYHSSRVTPDGHGIAFQSTRSLTGYDNTDALGGKADLEAYVYDADSDRLSCVSCNPSGARPLGQPLRGAFTVFDALEQGTGRWAAAWLTTEEEGLYTSHTLSDDGSHVFFNAFDALLPQDTNGQQDVYEWEAQGSGDCARSDGCLSLISTGQSPAKSEFVDANPSGQNVFFETESSIDPRDPGLIDIYDARIGGGFPTQSQPTPCVGDACQSPPPPPNDPTPASAGFKGAGDLKPRHDCSSAAKRAAKLTRTTKQMRSEAGQAASTAQAKRLRLSAERLEHKAKGLGKSAARCRRSNRRAGR